ncbi:MAG: class I SAM-dependent methyltransferase [Bacteroidota bacterium]
MKYPEQWTDYELLDCGEGRKLERFGSIVADRPEVAANWPKTNPELWDAASSRFIEQKGQTGYWSSSVPEQVIRYPLGKHPLKLSLKPVIFKHLGVFPEQAVNWEYIARRCNQISYQNDSVQVLNLFAYTGAASVVAAVQGASVTHIDTSKSVVDWARENATLNDITTIRWIVEDARTFVQKCVRRGERFQGVILDPPVFGMGKKGKNWKLERDLPDLLASVMQILDTEHRFFVLNTYSPQLPLHKLNQLLKKVSGFPLAYEQTTLGLRSRTGRHVELGNLIRF